MESAVAYLPSTIIMEKNVVNSRMNIKNKNK